MLCYEKFAQEKFLLSFCRTVCSEETVSFIIFSTILIASVYTAYMLKILKQYAFLQCFFKEPTKTVGNLTFATVKFSDVNLL